MKKYVEAETKATAPLLTGREGFESVICSAIGRTVGNKSIVCKTIVNFDESNVIDFTVHFRVSHNGKVIKRTLSYSEAAVFYNQI